MPVDDAALAANWRTVLLVDAALGLLAALGGVAVAVLLHIVAGVTLAGAGLAYLGLVGRRYGQWRRRREDAGL